MVSKSSIVVASRQQVSSDLAGEVVILDLKNGMYYGLNAVGAFIWRLIQEPRLVGEIRDAILDEYEVESDHCEHDLIALLQELGAVGLVEIPDQVNGSGPVR
jgi:Coenzyme PQQ synthesis protein D (PqqD)